MLALMATRPALEAELEQALPRGYVAAFRWLGNRDESREVCQEAAARALAAGERFDGTRPFYPWFYRILKNLCLDRIGRRSHARRAEEELAHLPRASRDTESELVLRERQRAVARAIEGLAPELREVIELRHFQDLSYEEMAEVIGCPTGTVMSRLYRARKALRQRLVEGGTP
jgi:RNA polymerase sigma-70 factor (ECF subfamily)